MVAPAGLIIVDTPIFAIDLRYQRDRHFKVNRSFLDYIAQRGNAGTTIFKLLEVCGILSFNLNQEQLSELFQYFHDHYKIDILPHSTMESSLPSVKVEDLFSIISRKTGLGDALIIAAIEKYVPGAAWFVSWNARHFKGRLSIPPLTPREFLDRYS